MLEIIEVGLIFESSDGNEFRHLIFSDNKTGKKVKYIVFKKRNPYLWKIIEKHEKNRLGELGVKGAIENYKGIDIVILEGELKEEAYFKQKWRLKEEHKITRKEAIQKIEYSVGYITDRNINDSLTPGWIPLDLNATMIRFRYYRKSKSESKLPGFYWSDWFEIID